MKTFYNNLKTQTQENPLYAIAVACTVVIAYRHVSVLARVMLKKK